MSNDLTIAQPIPTKWIERIFSELSGMHGKLFADMWAGVEPETVKDKWARSLSGFTGEEIAKGLLACEMREFPPTLPMFKQLCRPALDPEFAFAEAVKGMIERENGKMGKWSHPAVFWASVALGGDLRAYPYTIIKNRWQTVLSESWAKSEWREIPPSRVALPPPDQVIDKDAAREQLQNLMKLFGQKGL